MAGDWVVWTKGLSRKREVLAIAEATGLDRRQVAALLMEFWEWADGETSDGLLPGLTIRSLSALHADVLPQFFHAMSAVGWVIEETAGVRLPHFDRWMGRSAKRRLKDILRKRHDPMRIPQDVRMRSGRTSASQADEIRPIDRDRDREKKKPPLPPIPSDLDTPEFREAWDRWQAHRREIRAPLTPTSVSRQFAALAAMGVTRAVACIDHTILKGWTGLREDDAPKAAPPTFDDLFRRAKEGKQP